MRSRSAPSDDASCGSQATAASTPADDDVEIGRHADADEGLGHERRVLVAQHAPITVVDAEEDRRALRNQEDIGHLVGMRAVSGVKLAI